MQNKTPLEINLKLYIIFIIIKKLKILMQWAAAVAHSVKAFTSRAEGWVFRIPAATDLSR